MKCVVIIGLGIVFSIGNNQQEVLVFLCEGCLGIIFFQELKDFGMCSYVWGNVKLDIIGFIDCKVVCFMSDVFIYVFFFMEQVIVDVGFFSEVYQNNLCVGLIVGFGGGFLCFQVFGVDVMCGLCGLKVVGLYVVIKVMVFGVFVCFVILFKIYGVNYFISFVCVIFVYCIGNVVEQI